MTEQKKLTLQKFLQQSGFDSRRNIRQMINEGQFKVNQKRISDPGFLIDFQADLVTFQNKRIKPVIEKKTYFLFNKPYGVISSLADPQKRPTVKDFIGKIRERVYPVGRLDYQSEGLILLTNDGDLTNFIISPRNQIPKVYMIKIQGILSPEKKAKLEKQGFFLDGQRVKSMKIRAVKKTQHNHQWLQVSIFEGKKHIVRNIFKYMGHPVEKLRRVAIGTFRLKNIPPGHWREVTEQELTAFKKKFRYQSAK